jgi:hypothetical protein
LCSQEAKPPLDDLCLDIRRESDRKRHVNKMGSSQARAWGFLVFNPVREIVRCVGGARKLNTFGGEK